MAAVMQAYRFALDPTPRQQGQLASHTGAARFAFNWGLALVKTRLDQRQTDPAVQVPWTLFELQREWNQAKCYWTTLSAWKSHTRWGWGGRLVGSR